MAWITLILGSFFVLLGIFVVMSSIIGNFKFSYVCNRMHAASMQDSLGLLSILLGLIILSGFNVQSLKLIFVILFYWISSPTCAHLLVRLEITTNNHLDEEMEVIEK